MCANGAICPAVSTRLGRPWLPLAAALDRTLSRALLLSGEDGESAGSVASAWLVEIGSGLTLALGKLWQPAMHTVRHNHQVSWTARCIQPTLPKREMTCNESDETATGTRSVSQEEPSVSCPSLTLRVSGLR